jgi:hypothetical protein
MAIACLRLLTLPCRPFPDFRFPRFALRMALPTAFLAPEPYRFFELVERFRMSHLIPNLSTPFWSARFLTSLRGAAAFESAAYGVEPPQIGQGLRARRLGHSVVAHVARERHQLGRDLVTLGIGLLGGLLAIDLDIDGERNGLAQARSSPGFSGGSFASTIASTTVGRGERKAFSIVGLRSSGVLHR